MKILGIWDGHDSGAALIEEDKILFAINEERLTRRKLEVAFPLHSINACLKYTNTLVQDISEIAISTSDVAKTITRIMPSLKEEYYLIRRRKKKPKKSSFLKKKIKYKLTEYPSFSITKCISKKIIQSKLKKFGFKDFRIHFVDHHLSHASTAAFCSGFKECLVITLDGLGDGFSGSIYKYIDGNLEFITSISARHSIGIFFEHVTNLMNMRELEDEGKVMALANYAFPVDSNKNPLMDLIDIDGISVYCRYSSLKMFNVLKDILWQYPSEQFAYMAQQTLEVKICKLVKNALMKTNLNYLCLSGGVFSNVKVNRLLKNLPEVKKCFVFPHMGDGGLALGAAFATQNNLNGIHRIFFDNIFFGPKYSDDEIEDVLKKYSISYTHCSDIAKKVSEIIYDGGIVFWFQGAMELGPRALGNRSIIARPDSIDIKDELNLKLKKRVWYQPFCPSMLEEDAQEILEDYDGNPNKYMTMAYLVKKSKRSFVSGVINCDGSCRPQIVGNDHSVYQNLLLEVKKLTGHGIVLNTSLNIHGEPLVCSPDDAVKTMLTTGCHNMAIGDFWISIK